MKSMTAMNPESISEYTADILVIGAGPAGMMAAVTAAGNGAAVLLAERNEKPGRKLAITGKGRCNVTNNSDIRTMEAQMVSNPKFILSALNRFNQQDTMRFFESRGVPLKTERGQRVFPQSDKAFDIVDAMRAALRKAGVRVIYGTRIERLERTDNGFTAQTTDGKMRIKANQVILSTGGVSYPVTGSTGDGFAMAEGLGHSVTDLREGLVPFNVKEAWPKRLQGLSLKNIAVSVTVDGKEVFSDFGEMLFAHFGVTGPVVLSASSRLQQWLKSRKQTISSAGNVVFHIDLKPALSEEKLLARLERDLQKHAKKQMRGALEELLPKRLIPEVLEQADIGSDRRADSLNQAEKLRLVRTLKNMTATITGTRSMQEAIITIGGVQVKEVDPKTMESRLVPGLYFAGEVLDTDALTGGFNLQIAFSTGYAAGLAAAAGSAAE